MFDDEFLEGVVWDAEFLGCAKNVDDCSQAVFVLRWLWERESLWKIVSV